MKTIKAKSSLDNNLLEKDPNYPIFGNFLDKYKYLDIIIERDKNNLSKEDLQLFLCEKERLGERASFEGGNKIKRFIQHLFSLYPYEE